MGRLDDMKAAIAAKPPAKPKPPPKPKKAKTPKEPPPKPEVKEKPIKPAKPIAEIGTLVPYGCGHKVGVGQFLKRVCECCRNVERKAKILRYIHKEFHHRLPPGTVKNCVWDGTNWRVEMTVPGIPDFFWYEAQTERVAIHGVHAEFMQWISENPFPAEPEPVPGTPEPTPVAEEPK